MLVNEKLGVIDAPGFDDIYGFLGIGKAETSQTDFSVSFLDVGQGDCAVIRSGTDFVVIDTGEEDHSDAVIGELHAMGADELDYLVISHSHTDHCGGAAALLRAFTVKCAVLSRYDDSFSGSTETGQAVADAVSDLAEKCVFAEAGYAFELGEAHFKVVSPVGGHKELNDSSLVIRMVYKGAAFLFTGDAGFEAENEMLQRYGKELRADVLKVGHHGSSSASSHEFLEAVRPDYAVISCGRGNEYGHPHYSAVKIIGNTGAKICRTDLMGSITFTVDQAGRVSVDYQKAAA